MEEESPSAVSPASSADVSVQDEGRDAEQARRKALPAPAPALPRLYDKIATSRYTWCWGTPLDDLDIPDNGQELLYFKSADPALSWRLEMNWDTDDADDEAMLKLSLQDMRAENLAHLRVKTRLEVKRRRQQENVQVQILSEDGIVGKIKPDDAVTFTVKLTTYYKKGLCSVCNDWKRLLESLELADLTLRVDGKELRVHRQVLCARSPVLRRMLLSDFVESRASEIEISGIPHAAFSKLLEFLYTGQVEDFEGFEMDVLVAADRYAVMDLKALCQKEIVLQLDAENVLNALVLADNMDAKELKEGSLKVAAAKIEEIMRASGWVEFRKNHGNLVDDILIATRQKCADEK